MTKEEKKEYNRLYYLKNKEKKKQYQQEHKDDIAEYQKQYQKEHKEEIAEYRKQYQQEHKKEILEQHKQYCQTPMGRAINLVGNYRQNDKKYNRGECTLTPQWIIDNIFTSKCHYCKETDWTELGCDRIDNDKPHTPENVVCCCEECNKKRGTMAYEEFLKKTKAPVAYV